MQLYACTCVVWNRAVSRTRKLQLQSGHRSCTADVRSFQLQLSTLISFFLLCLCFFFCRASAYMLLQFAYHDPYAVPFLRRPQKMHRWHVDGPAAVQSRIVKRNSTQKAKNRCAGRSFHHRFIGRRIPMQLVKGLNYRRHATSGTENFAEAFNAGPFPIDVSRRFLCNNRINRWID